MAVAQCHYQVAEGPEGDDGAHHRKKPAGPGERLWRAQTVRPGLPSGARPRNVVRFSDARAVQVTLQRAIVGRADEPSIVHRFTDRAAHGPASLVLEGLPGGSELTSPAGAAPASTWRSTVAGRDSGALEYRRNLVVFVPRSRAPRWYWNLLICRIGHRRRRVFS
jgi:hypothetical protein